MRSDASSTDNCCLGFDEDMQELIELYLEETPARISTLQNAWDQQDWPGLQRLAHQIKGSAAGYGFPEISTLGLSVESAIKNGRPSEKIGEKTQNLIAAFDRLLAENASSDH